MDSFECFVQNILKLVENVTGITPKMKSVDKNNGVKLSAIIILEEGCKISPSIYLEPFYDEYRNGKSISEIVDNIINIHKKSRLACSFNIDKFMDFNCAKENIVYKVVNAEMNKELLTDIPHQKILDLAKIYVYVVETEFGTETVLLHKVHLRFWNISEEELYLLAEKNTPNKLPCSCEDVEKVICEIMGEDADLRRQNGKISIFVLTNYKKMHGAACIFYKGALNKIARENGYDLLVIPSSVHEVMIIPYNEDEIEGIKMIVKEINETVVDPEEVLSEQVYVYTKDDDMLKIAR